MALSKIRPLWPDFWTDDKIVALSPFARLFYQGLWTYACDNGHLEDRSRQLKRLILPDDDVNAAELLIEIQAQDLVERVDGWLIVTGAAARWKTDWRYFKTCDRPDCQKPERETRRGNDVATPGPHGDHGRTRRDHATEGVRVRDGVRDGDGEEDPSLTATPKSPARASSDAPERFEEFWDTYAKKQGRKAALEAYKRALKKTDEQTIIWAAAAYVDKKRAEGGHPKFTKDAVRWLNGEHWNDETTAAPSPVRSLHASELISPPDGMDAATYNQWLMATNPKHRAAQERQGVTFTPDVIPGWSA